MLFFALHRAAAMIKAEPNLYPTLPLPLPHPYPPPVLDPTLPLPCLWAVVRTSTAKVLQDWPAKC